MSSAIESEDAPIGYKIKRGDYIIMTTPFNREKVYKVTKTDSHVAHVQLRGRRNLRFNRYYYLPFIPLLRTGQVDEYESPNKWHVRINDTKIKKRLRL